MPSYAYFQGKQRLPQGKKRHVSTMYCVRSCNLFNIIFSYFSQLHVIFTIRLVSGVQHSG